MSKLIFPGIKSFNSFLQSIYKKEEIFGDMVTAAEHFPEFSPLRFSLEFSLLTFDGAGDVMKYGNFYNIILK